MALPRTCIRCADMKGPERGGVIVLTLAAYLALRSAVAPQHIVTIYRKVASSVFIAGVIHLLNKQ